jgi:Sec-independent protein secretion pathway component TatC
VFTPPDFVSQLALAFPLVGLYFLTLLVARVLRLGEG